MPRKCCVPKCDSNYRGKKYTTTFRFPKDDFRKHIWITRISRKDFVPNQNSVVCEKHFEEKDIIRYDAIPKADGTSSLHLKRFPKLRKDAVPSTFPHLPSYITKKSAERQTSPSKRETALNKRKEEERLEKAKHLQDKYLIKELNDLNKLASEKENTCADWIFNYNKDYSEFLLLDKSFIYPKVVAYMTVSNDLTYTVFLNGIEVGKKELQSFRCFATKLTSWVQVRHILLTFNNAAFNRNETPDVCNLFCTVIINALQELLHRIKEKDADDERICSLTFFIEQLKLLNCAPNHYTYDSDILLFAYTLYIKSPSAYNYVRESGILRLPHTRTLQKMSSTFTETDTKYEFLHHLKKKATFLKKDEKVN